MRSERIARCPQPTNYLIKACRWSSAPLAARGGFSTISSGVGVFPGVLFDLSIPLKEDDDQMSGVRP
jgi:hypothetical protein